MSSFFCLQKKFKKNVVSCCGFACLAGYISDTAAEKAPKSYFGDWRIVRGVSIGGLRARCIVACYLALTLCSSVVAAVNQPDAQLYNISISVLNAAEAINRLAEQTGAILLYPYDLVKSRQTKLVDGRYTLIDALNRLLQGSGLLSGLSDKGVIKIFLDEETERDNKGRDMNQQQPIKPSIFKKIAGILFAGLLGTSSAGAQQADTSTGGMLEEIVVTAQKREQNVQDIALSVTALTPDALANGGITRLTNLDALVPGMNLSQSGNDPRIAMRGARTEGVLAGQDPAISFYSDGIYRSQTNQFMGSIVDVERVEVLRGPQGTLFGRNSFGGAIHVISNKPDASAFDFGTNVTLGQYSRVRSDGFVNVPVGGSAAFRIAWVKDTHDGKIKNIIEGNPDIRDRDEDYVRGQFAFELNDNIDVRLSTSYWSSDGNGNADFGHHFAGAPLVNGVLSSTAPGLTQVVAGPPNLFGTGTIKNLTDPFTIQGDGPFLQDNDQYTFDAEINWDLGFANVKFLFGYADSDRLMCTDGDFGPFRAIEQCEIDFAETFTEEITFTSLGDGPLKWTAGAFFLQDDKGSTFALACTRGVVGPGGIGADNLPDLTVGPFIEPDCFTSQDFIDTDSWAVYGQAAYRLTEQFEVEVGVRYTEDDKDWVGGNNFDQFGTPAGTFGGPGNVDGSAFGTLGLFGCCTVGGTIFNPIVLGTPSTDSASFKETTWMASGSWFVNDDVMAYAKFSTGFQSGGFNNTLNPVDETASFGPQFVDAYEAGIKATLLDGRMTFNLAFYHNDFEDMLAQTFLAVGGGIVTVNGNAGGAKATGVEVEVDWQASENLFLSLRANLVDSEYQDFILGGDGFPDTLNADGVSVLNLDGVSIQQTPDATVNLSGSYDISLGDYGTLRPHINVYWSDDHSVNDRARPWEIQDSYAKLDLRLFWESVDQHWLAEAFVENVGDKEILQRSVGFGGGMTIEDFKDPRTWGVRIGYRFN